MIDETFIRRIFFNILK